MSMIEKFLEDKRNLKKSFREIEDAAIKAVSEKANEMIDNFINGFKDMIAEASDEEFVEFITSGKLEDDDIAAAIMFRAKCGKHNRTGGITLDDSDDDSIPVHVIVLNRL